MNLRSRVRLGAAVVSAVLLLSSCYPLLHEVHITSPTDGEYTTESTVSIDVYTSSEIARLEVFYNGNLLGGLTEYTVDVVSNDENTVAANGYDEIGNLVESDAVTFYHDGIDPELTVEMSGSGRTLSFSGEAPDNYFIASFTYEHQTVADISGSIVPESDGSWLLTLTDVPYSNDTQTITFSVADPAGNTDSVPHTFTLRDEVRPALSVDSPATGTTHQPSEINFSGTATDDFNLAVLCYGVDHEELVVLSTGASGAFGVPIDFTGAADGTHEVRFIAIDSSFNFTQVIVSLTISAS
jgi:hypothetical protein